MPTLQNCPHSGDGWCLDCVKQLNDAHETWAYAHGPLCMTEKKDLANAIADAEIAKAERDALHRQLDAVKAEQDAAVAVVAKLPKTADGVPVVPGMSMNRCTECKGRAFFWHCNAGWGLATCLACKVLNWFKK
jgi:hypothetical protein